MGDNASSATGKRTGRTTGACAAAAAVAAWRLRVDGAAPAAVTVPLPDGGWLEVPVAWALPGAAPDAPGAAPGCAATAWSAGVLKDGGDDPDVTHGLTVVARLTANPGGGLVFAAGEGVGTVTRPGLSVPVGEPAINPGPRKMIAAALRAAGAGMDWLVTIAIPGGGEAARATQNERLGVVGGLSILGTTGIVRPYCVKARREAFRAQCAVARAGGAGGMALVPGNIGAKALSRHFRLSPETLLETGNDWDGALDAFRDAGFARLLVGGHPGKLGKLAVGDWATHSADTPPALVTVRRLAAELGIRPDGETGDTTEGYFTALTPEARSRLADALALAVAERLGTRLGKGTAVAVWLCDMKGRRLGSAGTFSYWSPIMADE